MSERLLVLMGSIRTFAADGNKIRFAGQSCRTHLEILHELCQ